MISEYQTERGRTLSGLNTEEGFEQAFERMLIDYSMDIEAPKELLDKNGIFDSTDDHGLLDETD